MRGVAVLCVLCSVLVAVPVAVLWRDGARRNDEPPPAMNPGTPHDARLDELLSRMQRIEERIDGLAARSGDLRAPVGTGTAPAGPELAALERRLARLEAAASAPMGGTVAAVQSQQRLLPRAARAEMDPETKAALVRPAERTILDPAAPVEEKLAAHERLRRVPDAYTPPMVQELLRIAETSQRAETRADVWRFFDGASRLPHLVPPMLQALANDADWIAREEAAETLGNYLDDPVVLGALRWTAEHDAHERVRAKAQRTLLGDPVR
jgi:hypothetical protein